jgi:crotonobetainyl-CoA:carnitine CoA-transferase CaiB-like acyl-CoA transferase
MVIEVEHERVGKVRSLGGPVKLSYSAPSGRSGARADRGAPLLGQHTREVLLEADWSGEQIDALAEGGSVLAL